LSDLKGSCGTFSELLQWAERTGTGELRAMAPQVINASKKGFTMVLYGDEKYLPSEGGGEEKSQTGGRHRVLIVSDNGRPRRMSMERNIRTPRDVKL
jgi:hypothetical protein